MRVASEEITEDTQYINKTLDAKNMSTYLNTFKSDRPVTPDKPKNKKSNFKQSTTQYEEEEDDFSEDFIEKVMITARQSDYRQTGRSKSFLDEEEDRINIRGREESFAVFDRFLFQIMIGNGPANTHGSTRVTDLSVNT